MIFTETHTIILELWDKLNAELERLETKAQNGTASREEHDWLCEFSDIQGALMWAIQGKPISVNTLAGLLSAAKAVWSAA